MRSSPILVCQSPLLHSESINYNIPVGKTLTEFVKRHWDTIILTLLISVYTVVLATLSVRRHNAFASLFDLANMDQTLWYTLNGHFFQFRLPDDFVSRFSVHADILLILLSPLYIIWNDVRALLVSSSFFLALGAIPVFLLSRTLLGRKIPALILALAYLLNPGVQWTNIYDFHAVSLAIPLLLAAFYCAHAKRWRWYAVWTILAILTKEDISLNIAMMGLMIALVYKERVVGVITFLLGIAWFFSMVTVVMPYFSPNNIHWALDKMTGSVENPLAQTISRYTDPRVLISTFITNPKTIEYYTLLLKQFAYVPILGLPWLLLGAPALAINVIRDTTSITFHYDSGVIPALVIATIYGFYYLKRILMLIPLQKSLRVGVMTVFMLLFITAVSRVNYHYSPLPTTPSCSCYIYNVTDEDREFEKKLQSIPKDASITASLEIRPHVSHRELAFTLPSATESATYIAMITQNRIISDYDEKTYEKELIADLKSKPDQFEILHASEHFYLFKRRLQVDL